jgi:hypothetical protein
VHADIDLDHDAQCVPSALQCRTEFLDMRGAVDTDDGIGERQQIYEAPHLGRSDNLVGDQDIADATCRKHLRLTELGAGNADRSVAPAASSF